jgi:hypothetical protein
MARSTFIYVTYIRTTPEKLWSALADDVEFMKRSTRSARTLETYAESLSDTGSSPVQISLIDAPKDLGAGQSTPTRNATCRRGY